MKIKILLSLILIQLFISAISGRTSDVIVQNLDSLMKDQDAVILIDKTEFEVNNIENADYTLFRKILINNKNADDYCNVIITGSQFVKIEDVEAVLKDLDGNIIKELDSDDIKEGEASFGKFYTGDTYNYFKLTHHTYPYIIEYKIEKEYSTLFFWPSWTPQFSIPTIKSSYKLINDDNIEFSHKSIGIDVEPKINSNNTYIWTLNNIPKILDEDFIPPENELQMAVLFKSNSFMLGDYSGNSDSWNKYGTFYNELTLGRYDLPEKAKKEISNLVKDITDTRKKIDILYKYLQNKNRYVDIEIGIRGWQPQSASDVYNNRYGDCKDLSTFMIAMLRHVGIKAYPALALTRGRGEVYEDFPSSQFNHCIAMVPLVEDTLWLECTASYLDLEDTPYSIEDIKALVVDENGAKLIKTSKKSSDENISRTLISGTLSLTGKFKYNTKISTTGNRKNYFLNNISTKNENEKVDFLQAILNDYYTNVYIDNYKITNSDDLEKEYTLDVYGEYKKFVSTRGKRIFLNPAIYNRKSLNNIPEESVEERKYPIFYNYPYKDVDSVEIKIPNGYILESLPKNKTYELNYAKYYCNYFFKDNILTYRRYYELKENKIPVEKYAEFIEFLNKVVKADNSKVVIKKGA